MNAVFSNTYLPCCNDCPYLLPERIDDRYRATTYTDDNVTNEAFVGSITTGCQSKCHIYLREGKNMMKTKTRYVIVRPIEGDFMHDVTGSTVLTFETVEEASLFLTNNNFTQEVIDYFNIVSVRVEQKSDGTWRVRGIDNETECKKEKEKTNDGDN